MQQFISILFSFFFITSLLSAQSFEGTVHLNHVSEGQEYESIWSIKNNQVALELILNSEKGQYRPRFIPDLSKSELLIITKTPSEEFEHRQAISEIKTPEEFELSGFQATLKEETKTIKGYECQLVEARTNNTITEIWVAKAIPVNFNAYKDYFKADYALLALMQLNLKGFPIQYETKSATGSAIMKSSPKAISLGKVPASNFSN